MAGRILPCQKISQTKVNRSNFLRWESSNSTLWQQNIAKLHGSFTHGISLNLKHFIADRWKTNCFNNVCHTQKSLKQTLPRPIATDSPLIVPWCQGLSWKPWGLTSLLPHPVKRIFSAFSKKWQNFLWKNIGASKWLEHMDCWWQFHKKQEIPSSQFTFKKKHLMLSWRENGTLLQTSKPFESVDFERNWPGSWPKICRTLWVRWPGYQTLNPPRRFSSSHLPHTNTHIFHFWGRLFLEPWCGQKFPKPRVKIPLLSEFAGPTSTASLRMFPAAWHLSNVAGLVGGLTPVTSEWKCPVSGMWIHDISTMCQCVHFLGCVRLLQCKCLCQCTPNAFNCFMSFLMLRFEVKL